MPLLWCIKRCLMRYCWSRKMRPQCTHVNEPAILHWIDWGFKMMEIIIHPAQRNWRGVYWFHLVRLSVGPSVRPSVRLWTESCPLCIFYNTHRINFILTHLIKWLQTGCHVYFFQNSNVLANSLMCNFDLSCFDLGSNMNWPIVWVIMGRRGYPQNAGVLVILVLTVPMPTMFLLIAMHVIYNYTLDSSRSGIWFSLFRFYI